jgi:lipopolysaccharide biosynthesis glycosyltransferase
MLHSVLSQAESNPVHVHYLHGPSFPACSLDLIGRMVRGRRGAFTTHEIAPERVAGLPVVDMFTAAMWYRIFLPELLPDVDRVLYLDVDTLAMAPIAPLWEVDLSGSYLAAVTNVLMPYHRDKPASLGLEPGAYFNSGVLLMNLDEMRRNNATAALREYALAHGRSLELPDQDTLNVVLGGKRAPLHPRWNSMNALRVPWSAEVFGAQAVEEARREPAIRHFEGPDDNKPWDPRCFAANREMYFAHRAQTPFPRWPRRRLRRSLSALRRSVRCSRSD